MAQAGGEREREREREAEPEDMQHCVDMLTGGFVQSYVDFFSLVHAPEDGTRASTKAVLDLALVRDKLTGAEKARRSGESKSVVRHYKELADYFCGAGAGAGAGAKTGAGAGAKTGAGAGAKTGAGAGAETVEGVCVAPSLAAGDSDPATGIYFLEKCAQISVLTNDVEAEKEAHLELGLALQRVPGKTQEAITRLERLLELATSTEDKAGMSTARKQLAVVYDKRATELEKSQGPGQRREQCMQQVVELLSRCVRIASEEKDSDFKARASFRLGCAYDELGEPDRAIVALSLFFDHAERSGDVKGKAEASEAIAAAYLHIGGKEDKAVQFLEEALTLAQQINATQVQASACRRLGAVHTQCGNFGKAVQYFEQSFELVSKNQTLDLRSVDEARVLLGVALKNARTSQHMRMVTSDAPALLGWRLTRDFSKAVAQ